MITVFRCFSFSAPGSVSAQLLESVNMLCVAAYVDLTIRQQGNELHFHHGSDKLFNLGVIIKL